MRSETIYIFSISILILIGGILGLSSTTTESPRPFLLGCPLFFVGMGMLVIIILDEIKYMINNPEDSEDEE